MWVGAELGRPEGARGPEEGRQDVSLVGSFQKPVPVKTWPRWQPANSPFLFQAVAGTPGGWVCTESGAPFLLVLVRVTISCVAFSSRQRSHGGQL